MDINESDSDLAGRALAVAAALDELNVGPDDRVLIMLPEGPGFTDAVTSVTRLGAVPLPLNPLLPAHDITAAAIQTGARLVLTSADRIQTLDDLDADSPVLVHGLHGIWAAVLRLR